MRHADGRKFSFGNALKVLMLVPISALLWLPEEVSVFGISYQKVLSDEERELSSTINDLTLIDEATAARLEPAVIDAARCYLSRRSLPLAWKAVKAHPKLPQYGLSLYWLLYSSFIHPFPNFR
jgi:hypothetical protein